MDNNQKRIDNIINDIIGIAEESLTTMKSQVTSMKVQDPFVIAPPEEVKKITEYIKTVKAIIDSNKDFDL